MRNKYISTESNELLSYFNEKNRFYNVWILKKRLSTAFLSLIAGGIFEIAKDIRIPANQIKFDKLLEYAKRLKSQEVSKQLGFLLDLSEIDTPILQNY